MTEPLESIALQLRKGRIDEADQVLMTIPETNENRHELTFLKGYVQELRYDRINALKTYQQVLEQQPEHTGAAFRAALLYDQHGDEDTAIDLFEQCIKRTPAPVNALINLAVMCEERGQLPKAEAILNSILDEYPTHVRAKQLLQSVQSSYGMYFDEQSHRDREKRDAVLDTPVSDFELSVRSRNCLRQMNVRTLRDLLNISEVELLSYKNFGETSLNEIKAMLDQKSMSLGQLLQTIEPQVPIHTEAVPDDVSVHLRRSISELELSVRSRKALQRLGVTTLGELTVHSEHELMKIKNFGATSLVEIKQQLVLFGLSLR